MEKLLERNNIYNQVIKRHMIIVIQCKIGFVKR